MTHGLLTLLFWAGFTPPMLVAWATGNYGWAYAGFGYGTGMLVAMVAILYLLKKSDR